MTLIFFVQIMMKVSLRTILSHPMLPVQQFRQMREQQLTWLTVDKVSMLFMVLCHFQINRRESFVESLTHFLAGKMKASTLAVDCFWAYTRLVCMVLFS